MMTIDGKINSIVTDCVWLLLEQTELSEVMGTKAWAKGKTWFRSRRMNFPSKARYLCSLKLIWWTGMNHLLLSVWLCCIYMIRQLNFVAYLKTNTHTHTHWDTKTKQQIST